MSKLIENSQGLKILEITKKYPKQWVTVEITERDKYGFPARGSVISSGNDRDSIMNETKGKKGDLYTFYTGIINDEAN